MSEKVRIGLALSGGGARGIAHIGVIKAFEEHGIQVDAVAGSSAGSIVGALYAAGLSADEMLAFVKESSLFKLFKVGLPSDGLTKLTYLRDKLRELMPEDSFEALGIPLFIAVSNLVTGKLEIKQTGSLSQVVMASSSIPLVFKPVEIDGDLYTDGGVMDNLPVGPLLKQTDLVIGVNVMPQYNVSPKSVQNIFGIATRVFDMAAWANTQINLRHCHLTIEPAGLHRYHIFQINKYKDIYQLGYEEAVAKIPDLKQALEQFPSRED
jgi:NTE family protein